MKPLLLFLFLCFLVGFFLWDRAPRWRYSFLVVLVLALSVGYFFLRRF